MVAHAGKVFHASAPDQHDRVLLEIMALARNVTGHFELIGETHARHFAQRRVRLLRRRGVDAPTNPPLLRAGLQGRHLVPLDRHSARLADQLLYRRHLAFVRSSKRAEPASSKIPGVRPTIPSVGKSPCNFKAEARGQSPFTFGPSAQRTSEAKNPQ